VERAAVEIDKATLRMIFNAIRSSFKRSDLYHEERERYRSKKTGPRGGVRYDCAICKKATEQKDIEMDHYPAPVVPIGTRWHQLTVQDYYDNVFGLSVRALCKSCHKAHTKQQKKQRNTAAKDKKPKPARKKRK
jgi:hypothetical protein